MFLKSKTQNTTRKKKSRYNWNLVEEEIGEELRRSEKLSAAWAIALVLEMSYDAHIAEAMAAGC